MNEVAAGSDFDAKDPYRVFDSLKNALERGDFPKIIVSSREKDGVVEESISVIEAINEWEERDASFGDSGVGALGSDVEGWELDNIRDERSELEDDALAVEGFSDEALNETLEGILKDAEAVRSFGEYSLVKDGGLKSDEFYDSFNDEKYSVKDYDSSVVHDSFDLKIKEDSVRDFHGVEEFVNRDRTILEIRGFRDIEAERKRFRRASF